MFISLSLSLSRARTHTHTLSVCLYVCVRLLDFANYSLSVILVICLYLSLVWG